MNTNRSSSTDGGQEVVSQISNIVVNGGHNGQTHVNDYSQANGHAEVNDHAQINDYAHTNNHNQTNGHGCIIGDTLATAGHANANVYLSGHTSSRKEHLYGCSTSKINGEYVRFTGGQVPIAICGMGMRLPGGINDAEGFWDVLYNGKDLRTVIPAERYNAKAFSNALGKKGAIQTQYGYFLDDDLSHLDASFFTMTKTDLERTDPQQRQILEVTRECLENAGEVNWRGKSIGCYVGAFSEDWLHAMLKENQLTGASSASGDLMIANRVSYEFDFKGPRYENSNDHLKIGEFAYTTLAWSSKPGARPLW